MLLGAFAVPAAPAIAWALVDLAIAVSFLVCLGLLWSWKRTIGRAFEWIGHKSIHASVKGFGFTVSPFGFLLTINQEVIDYLGKAVAATEHGMVYAFQRMIGMILWSVQETAGLAQDVYDAIRGAKATVTTTITKTLDAKTTALINKINGAVGALIHVTVPHIEHQIAALVHRLNALAHAAGHAIATPFPRIGRVERDLSGLRKRVKTLEKQLAVGVGAALLIRSLARLGLGWLRCGNVNKAGRAVCGMNPGLLEALLLDAAALTITFNLEEFARELQTVTGEAARLIHNFAD